jgi:uncharacterized membrane protein YkoI
MCNKVDAAMVSGGLRYLLCVGLAIVSQTLLIELARAAETTPTDAASSAVPADEEAAFSVAPPTSQNDGQNSEHRTEQDNAREAGQRGYIIPYGRVLKKIKQTVPGDVVKVRLYQRNITLWTYEFTVLDDAGRFTQISLNARTGAVISKKKR